MDQATKTLAGEIIGGVHDADLDKLQTAVRERKRILRDCATTKGRFELKRAHTGTLTGLRPAYINGAPVEIIEVKRTRVLCSLRLDVDLGDPRIITKLGSHPFSVPIVSFIPDPKEE